MPPLPALLPLSTAAAVLLSAAAGAALHHIRHGNSTDPSPAAAPGAAAAATNARPGSAAPRPAIPTRESLAALSPEARITALAAALPQMEIADLLPLVEHLLLVQRAAANASPVDPFDPLPHIVRPLLRALFTRWAELDAAGLMAFVESGPLRYDYTTRRLAVLALVEVRGLSALEEVRAKSPGLVREAAREMLIRQPHQLEALLPFLKGGEPKESLDPFDGSTPDSENQIAKVLSPELYLRYLNETGHAYAAWSALEKLTGTDPQRALQAVKSLTPGPGRDDLLANCLLTIAPVSEATLLETDYTVFRREFEAMADGSAKNRLTPYYAIVRMKENPDAALQWAQSLADPRQRTRALIAISGGMFAACKNTFLDFYGREGDAAERITRLVAAAWTAAPPTGSLSQIPASDRWTYPFKEWHIKDPAASEAWLATVQNPELRKLLVDSVDIPAAGKLQLLPDSATKIQAVAAGASLRRPFEIAKELAALRDSGQTTIPVPLLEAARLHHLEQSWLIGAEWEALTAIERHALSAAFIRHAANPPPPAMTGHLDLGTLYAAGMASNAFAADPNGEKKDWLTLFNSLPPAERSLGAYYEAGAAYIKKDEAAASEWLDSLPPGPERDAAATALVEHLVKPGDSRDGEAAFAWAAAMSGETERTRYTAEAARARAAEDPAAARAAVEGSALPPAEKSALLQSIPEGGTR